MCHVNALEPDQRRVYDAMSERWQIKVEYRIERVQPNMRLYGRARTAEYLGMIRDAFEEVAAEMGKSSERIAEAVTA